MTEPSTSPQGPWANTRAELAALWRQLPNRPLFVGLAVAWLGLFHLLGNSTFGYIDTRSLFVWMARVYQFSEDDAHGFLIPVVVLVFYGLKRQELAAVGKRLWWPGIGLVGMGLAVHTGGFLLQQTRLSVVGFFIGLYGLTGLAWGWAWLRASFFPFCLFAFCVPVASLGLTEAVTFPLRMWATKITVGLANGVLGMEVVREGTNLLDPGGRYQYDIAPACSGIRSLTAIMALGLIAGFVQLKQGWRRLVLLAAALPLAVAGNVLRLMLIVLAAEVFGQKAGNYVHENSVFSLLPYVPAVAGFWLLCYWLEEKPPAQTPEGPRA